MFFDVLLWMVHMPSVVVSVTFYSTQRIRHLSGKTCEACGYVRIECIWRWFFDLFSRSADFSLDHPFPATLLKAETRRKALLHNFIILHSPLISFIFVVRSPCGFECHFYFSSIRSHAIRNHSPLIRIIFRRKWNSTHHNHSGDDRNSARHQPNISSSPFSFY